MKLIKVEKKFNLDTVSLIGHIEGKKALQVYFCYPKSFDLYLNTNADPFIPVLLLPCMAKGEKLEICEPVSYKLFSQLNEIQDIYATWYPQEFKHIQVKAHKDFGIVKPTKQKTASFFSLGVDSFYSLLKNIYKPSTFATEIQYLIRIKGIAKRLSKENSTKGDPEVEKTAKNYKKKCLLGTTNLRDVFPIKWAQYYHGAGLAAVALSLSAGFSNVLIPSTHTYNQLFPWGSHPLLDRLWSTETTKIIHDGSEIERTDKLAQLLKWDEWPLTCLEVCVSRKHSDGNCGKCSKCIRTMVTLELLGHLTRIQTLPKELPTNFIDKIEVDNENKLSFAEENLKLAQKLGNHSKMAQMIDKKVREGRLLALIDNLPSSMKIRKKLLKYILSVKAIKFKV